VSWWQAWIVAGLAAVFVPWPLSIVLAAPFAAWAGWVLADSRAVCGWCGTRFRGTDWLCDECAENPETKP